MNLTTSFSSWQRPSSSFFVTPLIRNFFSEQSRITDTEVPGSWVALLECSFRRLRTTEDEEEDLQRARDQLLAQLQGSPEEQAELFYCLAEVHALLDELDKAKDAIEKVKKNLSCTVGENNLPYAAALSLNAQVLRMMAREESSKDEASAKSREQLCFQAIKDMSCALKLVQQHPNRTWHKFSFFFEQLGDMYMLVGAHDAAMRNWRRAIQHIRKEEVVKRDPAYFVEMLTAVGRWKAELGRFQQAIEFFEEGMEVQRRFGLKENLDLKLCVGVVHAQLGLDDRLIDLEETFEGNGGHTNHHPLYCLLLYAISHVLIKNDQIEQAFKKIQKSVDLQIKSNLQGTALSTKCAELLNKFETRSRNTDVSEEKALPEKLSILDELKDSQGRSDPAATASAFTNLGLWESLYGNAHAAQESFSRALSVAEHNGLDTSRAITLQSLAELVENIFEANDPEKLLESRASVESWMAQSLQPADAACLAFALGISYKVAGHSQDALKYFKLALEHQRSLREDMLTQQSRNLIRALTRGPVTRTLAKP